MAGSLDLNHTHPIWAGRGDAHMVAGALPAAARAQGYRRDARLRRPQVRLDTAFKACMRQRRLIPKPHHSTRSTSVSWQGRALHAQRPEGVLLPRGALLRPGRLAHAVRLLPPLPPDPAPGARRHRAHAPSHFGHEHRVRALRPNHGVRRRTVDWSGWSGPSHERVYSQYIDPHPIPPIPT